MKGQNAFETYSPVWRTCSRLFFLALAFPWFRLRYRGREHVPAEGPVLLVSNHQSFLDPAVVGSALRRRPVHFIARSSLAMPFSRRWLARVGTVLIDRKAPEKSAMRAVLDGLAAGRCVCLFAEGTRTRDGSVRRFRSGLDFLVRRARPTVVPVGIEGAFRALPRGRLLPRPARITATFGAPRPPEAVLAPGGIDDLRAEVARLARAPLAGGVGSGRSPSPSDEHPIPPAAEGAPRASGGDPEPVDGPPAARSSAHGAGGTGNARGKGPAPSSRDASSD